MMFINFCKQHFSSTMSLDINGTKLKDCDNKTNTKAYDVNEQQSVKLSFHLLCSFDYSTLYIRLPQLQINF
ncbi:hypothetical protein M0804_001358 [Polistes exclamans]|nr:hypothetical protein M0804_001358 [Polistes exclamans]